MTGVVVIAVAVVAVLGFVVLMSKVMARTPARREADGGDAGFSWGADGGGGDTDCGGGDGGGCGGGD